MFLMVSSIVTSRLLIVIVPKKGYPFVEVIASNHVEVKILSIY